MLRCSFSPLAVALALLAAPAWAQNELSNFAATGRGGVVNTFATGYQALGVNPANLGRAGGSRVAFTIGEVGAGVGSQSLSRRQLNKLIFHADEALSAAERTALIAGLNNGNALNLSADATAFGVAVRLPAGLGGLAFSAHQRLSGHAAFTQNSADLLVNGQHAALIQQYYDLAGQPRGGTQPPALSAALAGTALQLALTNEYNVGYGLPVLDVPGLKLAAGVGYRYVQGLGVADMRIEGGQVTAYSALAPVFDLNYSAALRGDANFNYQDGGKLRPVGTGHGFDLGLAAEVGKILRLGASITDLGWLRWTGNVLTFSDQQLRFPQYTGLADYQLISSVVDQFAHDEQSLFTYQAAQAHRARLPAKLRLGGGVRLSERLEAGLDVTVPLNQVAGNLPSTFVGAGLDFKPLRWLRLSSGLSAGAGYRFSLPLGATLVTPHWEAGLSTRDVTGYLAENNPYMSAALGVLRFKFGE